MRDDNAGVAIRQRGCHGSMTNVEGMTKPRKHGLTYRRFTSLIRGEARLTKRCIWVAPAAAGWFRRPAETIFRKVRNPERFRGCRGRRSDRYPDNRSFVRRVAGEKKSKKA